MECKLYNAVLTKQKSLPDEKIYEFFSSTAIAPVSHPARSLSVDLRFRDLFKAWITHNRF